MSVVTTVSHDDERKQPRPGSRARLYLALECDRPLAGSSRHTLADIEQVIVGRGAARTFARTTEAGVRTLRILVPDKRMSTVHARLVRDLERWVLEDADSKNGTLVDGKPVTRFMLGDGALFELGHTFFLFRDAEEPVAIPLPPDASSESIAARTPALVTFVAPLARTYDELARIAVSSVPVLLIGDTGTGKELIARAIHEISGATGDLVAVNCAALPETLVESELFGYRKGAFSGAVQDRPGLIRAADKGTLFLDEIGDLEPASQAALLRVLQEREVTPLGATKPIAIELRVVSATHHDLATRVTEGRFRRDLLARLTGFTLRLPALVDRREDLGILIAAILRHLKATAAVFTCDAARAVFRYRWPNNVRELEQSLGVAVALAGDGAIELDHLPQAVRGEAPVAPPPALSPRDQKRRDELVALLREHGGNVSAMARASGTSRVQLHRWLKRFQLDPNTFR